MRKPELYDFQAILGNLRPEDEAEYQASLGQTPRGLAASGFMSSAFGWIADHNGESVAFITATRKTHHHYGLSMAATSEWLHVAKHVTKFAKTVVFPALWDAGCRRAEAVMVDGHPTAGDWLEYLGARHEAEMPLAGINQETMHLYAFRASDPHIQKMMET